MLQVLIMNILFVFAFASPSEPSNENWIRFSLSSAATVSEFFALQPTTIDKKLEIALSTDK